MNTKTQMDAEQKELERQLLATGLFNESVGSGGGLQWRLTNTDFYAFVPLWRSRASWFRAVSLGLGVGGLCPAPISFEEVLESVNQEIAEQLLFHLDLFT